MHCYRTLTGPQLLFLGCKVGFAAPPASTMLRGEPWPIQSHPCGPNGEDIMERDFPVMTWLADQVRWSQVRRIERSGPEVVFVGLGV